MKIATRIFTILILRVMQRSLYFLWSLLLVGWLFVYVPCAYADTFALKIEARNKDNKQIGIFIAKAVKKKFPDIEEQYDNFLAVALSPLQYEQLLLQVGTLKATVAPAYQAEVNAIADVWQLKTKNQLGDRRLSVTEFWLLQLLADLTDVNKGSAFAMINPHNKNPIVARNVNWQASPDLKKLQTLSIYEYDNRTLVNIGFAGLVGVISGFNDQGLFVSLMDASKLQVTNAPAAKQASSFELRTVLMNMNNVTSANQALAQQRYARNQQILLADPENIAVLEQPALQSGLLRQLDSPLINEMPWHNRQQMVMVNCFVLKASARNCYTSQDHYQWERFTQLSKAFTKPSLSVTEIAMIMQDRANGSEAIFNNDTVQAFLFTPNDRKLYFATTLNQQANHNGVNYQFIKINPTSPDYTRIIIILLALTGVSGLVWFFVFLVRKKTNRGLVSK